MASQLALPNTPAPDTSLGHSRPRKRRRDRYTTSFEMDAQERAILQKLCDSSGVGVGQVIRAALRQYASAQGVDEELPLVS